MKLKAGLVKMFINDRLQGVFKYLRMNRIIFLITPVFLLSCEKELSEKQADYFMKLYGNYLENLPSGVLENDEGGYVITGTSETEENKKDIFFIRTDRFGRQVGEIKHYGGPEDEFGLNIEKIDEGYLICGSVFQENGYSNAFLLKVDTEGEQVGDMIVYGENNLINEEFKSVKQRPDKTYIAVGRLGSNFLITTYNPSGRSFGESFTGAGNTVLNALAVISDERSLACGNEGGMINIVHIDRDGNYFAQDHMGETGKLNFMASFTELSETRFLVLSSVSSTGPDLDVSLREIQYSYSQTGSVLGMEEIYNRIISGSGSYEANSVLKLADGKLALLITRTFAGDKNMLLYLLSPEGNPIGDPKEFGGSGDQAGISLLGSGNGILILGTNTFEGNSMITLIKTDNQGNIWE